MVVNVFNESWINLKSISHSEKRSFPFPGTICFCREQSEKNKNPLLLETGGDN